MTRRFPALCLLVTCFAMSPHPALAGGIGFTENGAQILGRDGAFVARGDHPLAIHYNPGALTLMPGHRIYLGANYVDLDLTFTRSGIDDLVIGPDNPGGIYDSAAISNESPPHLAPSFAWTYGAERWGAGFGVYGPPAYGSRSFPAEGPQRFLLTSSDILLGFITGSGAFRMSRAVSVGASLQWAVLKHGRFGLTVDGAPAGIFTQDETASTLAQTDLDVSDPMSISAIAGIHLRLTDWLELGLSSRLAPVVIEATGTTKLSFPDGDLAAMAGNKELAIVEKGCVPDPEAAEGSGCAIDEGVHFAYKLAPWVRAGVRYIARDADGKELYDVELDVVYELWSVMDAYELAFDGDLYFLGNVKPLEPMRFEKGMVDTWAIRLGSTWRPWGDVLKLRGGIHYESAAMPPEWTHIDFAAYERLGGAVGLGLELGSVSVDLAYQLVWQPTRDIAGSKVLMQRPLDPIENGTPVGNGTIESMFQTTAASVTVAF